MDRKIEYPGNNENAEIVLNDIDSDNRAKEGVGEIKKFDDTFPDHKPQEDIDEISSTDDV